MTLTIYSASGGSVPAVYTEAAARLGMLIAQGGHTLVNGAGRTGLMGAATDACLRHGGQAIGVIPEFMVSQGWHHKGMSRLVVTPDMHSRKETMAQMGDACIALPGGVGTLEELLEIITWKQLGLYLKPIIVLNTAGYYDRLFDLLRRAVDEQFMHPRHLDIWQVAATPEDALHLAATTPLWDASIRELAAL